MSNRAYNAHTKPWEVAVESLSGSGHAAEFLGGSAAFGGDKQTRGLSGRMGQMRPERGAGCFCLESSEFSIYNIMLSA